MRLPWPFGPRSSSGAVAAGPVTGPAVAAPAAGAASSPPAAPSRAWATLPPIRRASGDAPLVAPSHEFLSAVPGHTPLPPILRPLEHGAGPTAPAGLVVSRVTAAPAMAPAGGLPTRTAGRRAATGKPLGAPPTPGAAAAVDSAAGEDAPAAPSAAGASPSPAEVPVRRLTAVSPGGTAAPPPRPLTKTAPTLTPIGRPVVSRTVAEHGTPAPGASRAARPKPGLGAPLDHGAARSEGDGPRTQAPPGRWAERGGVPGRGDRTAEGAAGSPGMASPPDRLPAPRRRPGLGAPLPGTPPTAAVQRAADVRADGPSLRGDGEPGPRRPIADVPPAAPQAERGAGPAGGLPTLPVVPPAAPHGAAETRAGHGAERPARTAQRQAAGTAPIAARPTVGMRPLRPSATASRRAGATPPAPPPSAMPVPARWGPADPLPDVVTALSRPAGTAEPAGLPSPLASQPRDGGEGGHGVRETAVALRAPAPDAASVSVQRSAGPGPGDIPAASGAGAGSARARTAADRPLALGRAPAASRAAGQPAQQAAPGASVGWIVADPSRPSAPPTVQMSRPAPGHVPVATFTATPVVQREAAASVAAAPAAGQPTDAELDELAGRLFGRIRRQLRAEVLHEREAKGLSFDAF